MSYFLQQLSYGKGETTFICESISYLSGKPYLGINGHLIIFQKGVF